MTDATKRPVLVLNVSYEPINVVSVRRAIILLTKGAAAVEESTEHLLRSGRTAIRAPSVVRLLRYHRLPVYRVTLSRRNILLRDESVCQYCAKKFPAAELTLDHVIPRAQSGVSSWENLVACCKPCNNRKDNRTPEEAGMSLLRRPRAAGAHTNRLMLRLAGRENVHWRKFLFY